MFSGYLEREEYEDALYGEGGDTPPSESESELEFRLYSQLHYSANHGAGEEDGGSPEEPGPPEPRELRQAAPGQTEQKRPQGATPGRKERKLRQAPRGQTKRRGLSEERGAFQLHEVIVIDSATDVITLSDSTEEEEGVCALKGQRSGPRPSEPVVVLGSDSSSEGMASDELESWMILGAGAREGDQSIQLNVEANAGSGDDDDRCWAISHKDKTAQITNIRLGSRRPSNRYYAGKSVTCRSCNKTGHISHTCPTPKPQCCSLCGGLGHRMQACPSRHCANCGLPGHRFSDCIERLYWRKHCHRCGMTGHFLDACPEIWRQYHLTVESGQLIQASDLDNRAASYCYNCSKRGHFGFECKQKRMFNGTYPTAPYINHYNTPKELHQLNNRVEKKAQELREAGLLSGSRPPQGGAKGKPPSKRQKTKPGPGQRVEGGPAGTAARSWGAANVSKGHKKRARAGKSKKAKRSHAPLVDEAQDFPREGGAKKWVPKGPLKPKAPPPDHLFGAGRANALTKKKKRARGQERKAAKMAAATLYPSDENLFVIKQRMPRRKQ